MSSRPSTPSFMSSLFSLVRGSLPVLALSASVLSPNMAAAWGEEPGSARASHPEQTRQDRIFGGRQSGGCEWASVADIGGCTATLISPEIVMFAAHCGTNHKYAYFGNRDRRVKLDACFANPDYDKSRLGEGIDWAYCKVSNTRDTADIPIVPAISRQELKEIKPGHAVTLVGYGVHDLDAPRGVKVEVDTVLTGLDDEAHIGGDGADTCQGDSGGPAFVQIEDGSWRVLGITSYGGACGKGGHYALASNAARWIEKHSGVEVPDCSDPKGGSCEKLALDPGGQYGSWDKGGCQPGPTLKAGLVPHLTWISPQPGQRFEPGATVDAQFQLRFGSSKKHSLRVELNGKVIKSEGSADSTWQHSLQGLGQGQQVLRVFVLDENNGIVDVSRRAFRVAKSLGQTAVTSSSGAKSSSFSSSEDADGDRLSDPQELGCSLTATSSFWGQLPWLALFLGGFGQIRRRKN